jgi:hypothetical protein
MVIPFGLTNALVMF